MYPTSSERSSRSTVVIVGAGQAGTDAASALRLEGFAGRIVLVGGESVPPYARPPLSKAYLAGAAELSDIELRDKSFFEQQDIELIMGATVSAIDPAGHVVTLSDDTAIPYDTAILATGAEPRRHPDVRIAAARNVFTLRTEADASALRDRLEPGVRLVIIGGGYIGLEIGAAARRAGAEVTVLEASERVLSRVTSAPVSEFFQRVHADEGTKILTGASIADVELDEHGAVVALALADGQRLKTDVVLVGIGVTPRTELAERAGLAVDNGIVVDEFLRTSDPAIYAIGDVARHPCAQHGGFRRLESVPNASEQARTVAAAIVGQPRGHIALPWFWSDQYDLKLQSVGLAIQPFTVVVRESSESPRQICVLYLREDVLIAADIVNSSSDFAIAKRLVASGKPVNVETIGDPAVSLKTLLSRATAAV